VAAEMFVGRGSHISACGVELGNFVGGRVVATRGVVIRSLLYSISGSGKTVCVAVVVGTGVDRGVKVGVT